MRVWCFAVRSSAQLAPPGTSFLEAFQNCWLMTSGAMRRMSATRFDWPGRISRFPAFRAAMVSPTSSAVVISLNPASAKSYARSVFTAGGINSMTSTPDSSNWKRSDWV